MVAGRYPFYSGFDRRAAGALSLSTQCRAESGHATHKCPATHTLIASIIELWKGNSQEKYLNKGYCRKQNNIINKRSIINQLT